MIPELDGRDIDRDLELAGPVAGLVQRLAHDADRQVRNQPRRFGNVHERSRLEQPLGRRYPPRQNLEADQVAGPKVDLGLIEGHELAGFDRGANFVFQLSAREKLPLHFLVEPDLAVPAGAFCGIHRDIRSAQAVLGGHSPLDPGNSDRSGNVDGSGTEHERFGNCMDDIRDRPGDQLVGTLRDDDGKFVSPEPSAAGSVRRVASNNVGNVPEDFVANDMAIKVVDLLEKIEVQNEEGAAPRIRVRVGQRAHQVAPVGKARHMVRERAVMCNLLGNLVRGQC